MLLAVSEIKILYVLEKAISIIKYITVISTVFHYILLFISLLQTKTCFTKKSLLQKSTCFQDSKMARRHTTFYHCRQFITECNDGGWETDKN